MAMDSPHLDPPIRHVDDFRRVADAKSTLSALAIAAALCSIATYVRAFCGSNPGPLSSRTKVTPSSSARRQAIIDSASETASPMITFSPPLWSRASFSVPVCVLMTTIRHASSLPLPFAEVWLVAIDVATEPDLIDRMCELADEARKTARMRIVDD
jgi:hypothetical protein